MRRNRLPTPDPESPTRASPPRSRQRIGRSSVFQGHIARITPRTRSSDINTAEGEENERGTRNRWVYKRASDNERINNSESEHRDETEEYLSISSLRRNRTMEESNLGFDQFNVLTTENVVRPIQPYDRLTPDSDEEYNRLLIRREDDEDRFYEQSGFYPISDELLGDGPLGDELLNDEVLGDEGVSFRFNEDGSYEGGYYDDWLLGFTEYDDNRPSTSQRALEKLFILQHTIWMDLPNIESPEVLMERASRRDQCQQILRHYNRTL